MRRSLARSLYVIAIATAGTAIGLACSSSDTHPRNTGDNPGNPTPVGSDDGGGAVDGEAGAVEGGSTTLTCSPADGGGGCNTLGFCTGMVAVVEIKTPPPNMLGGSAPSGLYALTAYAVYTGGVSGGSIGSITTFRNTMRFSTHADSDAGATDAGTADADTDAGSVVDAGQSTAMDWQNYVADNMEPDPATQSGVVTFTGNQLKFDRTCPSVLMNSLSWQYTNAGNTFQMLTSAANGSSLLTFTKVGN